MITIFRNIDSSIVSDVISIEGNIPLGSIWIDLISPTLEEAKFLEKQLNIEIPSSEEIWKNHVLNRLYTENGTSYMNAAIITKSESKYPKTSPITFILTESCLVTIRNILPTSFNNFAHRIQHFPQKFHTAASLLEALLEEVIVRVAHNSEVVVEELDTLSHEIFDANTFEDYKTSPSYIMKEILRRLGACADLNSKINESLHSINRMLSFFKNISDSNIEVYKDISILVTDASTLAQQTAFLADKITFQLDATLGMINVEQNMIIKIFSVVAVFFLPPTLVSSIYGMNFVNMPELHWISGYPFAILLMILFALSPYMYFHRKGWL
jgi:magnesium transporter